MEITSEFSNNSKIPTEYTCDGENISPPLAISAIPSKAKTLVVIVDDPDAPSKTWVHWVVFNVLVLSPDMKIDQASQKVEGTNDFGNVGYGGPCPPSGVHHYHFKVYALNSELGLSEGAKKVEVEAGMKGKILAEAELVGVYQK